MKKGLLLVALLFILPMVAASISISQPRNVYNNGDILDLTISLNSVNSMNDFLLGSIVCDGGEFQVYKSVLAVKAGESKEVPISMPLDSSLFGNLSGNCDFKVGYGGEERISQNFEVSNVIDVVLKQDGFDYNPSATIAFSGTAVKKNGDLLEGYVNITLENTNISVKGFVINGSFAANVDLPIDIPAGNYRATANAYEESDSGILINEGKGLQQIKINQVVKTVEFALSSLNLSLGDSLVYTVVVGDQSGASAIRESNVSLTDSNGKLFESFNSVSGTAGNITINNSFAPGDYKLLTSVEGIEGTNDFSVGEMMRANFTVINNSLFVTNTGNVLYQKQIELFIGENKQKVDVDLEVGQEREYVLRAPNGYYAVAINDDGQVNALGTAFLTGNAISVQEYGQMIRGNIYSIVIWLIVILGATTAVVYYYRRIRKKTFSAKTPKLNVVQTSVSRMAMPVRQSNGGSVIEQGEKQECGVVVLKIKNMEEIRNSASNALESIDAALTAMKLLRAKIQEDNGSWTIAFIPKVTGEKDNGLRAIKASQRLEKDLQEHNRKYSQKIVFGIGVNLGELIVETSEGKSRFMASGNVLLQAKKIADRANGQAWISEGVRKRTLSAVKVEKTGDDSYRVVRIVERGNNNQFVERFKQRNPTE